MGLYGRDDALSKDTRSTPRTQEEVGLQNCGTLGMEGPRERQGCEDPGKDRGVGIQGKTQL